MNIEKLMQSETFRKAPSGGYVLAYTVKNVIYEPYHTIDEAVDLLRGSNVLELHLFNGHCEYRAVSSESRRAPEGYFDCFVSDESVKYEGENRYTDKYIEDMFLDRDGKDRLRAVNYLAYQEDNGMAYICNYRYAKDGGNQ